MLSGGLGIIGLRRRLSRCPTIVPFLRSAGDPTRLPDAANANAHHCRGPVSENKVRGTCGAYQFSKQRPAGRLAFGGDPLESQPNGELLSRRNLESGRDAARVAVGRRFAAWLPAEFAPPSPTSAPVASWRQHRTTGPTGEQDATGGETDGEGRPSARAAARRLDTWPCRVHGRKSRAAPASRRSPWPRSGIRTLTRSAPSVSVSRLAAIRQVPPFPPWSPHVRPRRGHGRCGLWPRRRDVAAGRDPAGAAIPAHTASTFARVAFTGVVACDPGVAT